VEHISWNWRVKQETTMDLIGSFEVILYARFRVLVKEALSWDGDEQARNKVS
jgi:hypothetical protein